jgi:hypothetical protein
LQPRIVPTLAQQRCARPPSTVFCASVTNDGVRQQQRGHRAVVRFRRGKRPISVEGTRLRVVRLDSKLIQLRGGRADGRRVTVPLGFKELTLQLSSADELSAWAVYRPTAQRCADGVEIWDEYAEPRWSDSGLVPL